MPSEAVCNLCKTNHSRFQCSGCRAVYYCSKEHQKSDWKNHRNDCIPYKVEVNHHLGRHLVAARCIPEGQIILKEKPLIEGPQQVTPPVCLGCYLLINESDKVDCSKCGWPLCSEKCENSVFHRLECEITARRKNGKIKIKSFAKGLSHPSYQCITVLRCLCLKKYQPSIWKKLLNLQSHSKERRNTDKQKSDFVFIADFIIKFFDLSEFSTEEILEVAGIVEVNAHEVPLTKPGYVAIYEKASMLEHSCRANCTKSFTSNGDLVIRSAEKIHAGEHLSICYTDSMWGRTARMNHLLETKFFSCRCPRCSDPTELGTHFNSVKCQNENCDGYSVPLIKEFEKGDISPFENSRIMTWTCEKCNNPSPKEYEIFEKANEAVLRLDKKSISSCRSFLNMYEKVFHKNHHLILSVKLALIDLLSWPNNLPSLDEKTLNWTIDTGSEILSVLKTLMPAENRLLGILLYQLQFAMMEKSRRETCKMSGRVDAATTRQHLMANYDVLKEAFKYLQNEPDSLPEGIIAKEAKTTLDTLRQICQ